jgi:hypothetical protein
VSKLEAKVISRFNSYLRPASEFPMPEFSFIDIELESARTLLAGLRDICSFEK